jgi:curli biogenesis system outer membrane secretion channel CsgG
LTSLNIRILDGRTSEVLATAQYHNSALHTYPSSQKEVVKMFAQLDQQKQPLVAAAN